MPSQSEQFMARWGWAAVPFGILIFTILAICGSWHVITGSLVIFRAEMSTRWPTTEGVVLRSRAKEVRVATRHAYVTEYLPDIRYRYSVAGTEYTSSAYSITAMNSPSLAKAEAIVDGFRVGDSATVYYLPRQPSVAVLRPGVDGGMWTNVLVGFAF
jgi:hypothetical protein